MDQSKCSSWAISLTQDEKEVSDVHKPAVPTCITPVPNPTRRCHHLEECMFPRFLHLDAKLIDNFCMGRVEAELHGKHAARLYIESLHLKPFMKDKTTLMKDLNDVKRKDGQVHPNLSKRPCLSLTQNNSSESKVVPISKQTTKGDSGEKVADLNRLAQSYFGGFYGKHACSLSNNDTSGKPICNFNSSRMKESENSTHAKTASPPFDISNHTNLQASGDVTSKQKAPMSPEMTTKPMNVNSQCKDRPENMKLDDSTLAEGTSVSMTNDSAYNCAIQEGRAQIMAANLLLESFRRTRRQYLSDKVFKCAWCDSTDKTGTGVKCCSGDCLIKCLECDLIGCGSSLSRDRGCKKQHIMLHFLVSGHRYGVSCGPLGEVYCFGCGDFVHQECFDQERERLFIEFNCSSLSWKDEPIIRGVDASSFVMVPEQGFVWNGLQATYPIHVPTNLVLAARSAAKRLSIFRGNAAERTVEWGPKSLELSLYIRKQYKAPASLIPTPVGFFNLGNTCYMASVLHCLVNCKQLERAFLDLAHPYQSCELLRKGNKRGCLSCAFDKVVLEYFGSANGIDAIAALEETEADSSSLASSRFVFHEAEMIIQTQERQRCGHPIILSSFLAETWKQVGMKQFAGQHQHDAQEFFNSFVHSLATSEAAYHDTCTKLKQMSCPTLIRKSISDEKKVEKHTKVNDVFTGSLRSMLVCRRCGCRRDQVEPFINVSLPLSRENTEGKITIQSCLDLFTKSEALADNVHCPSCNKNTESSQQHGFATLPEVLCLHLKRFDSLAQKKLTEHVSFPLHDLDMGKYLAQWCKTTNSTKSYDEKPPKIFYDLFGTVNHNGSLDQGHYTANILKGKHWYTINDEFVSNAGTGDGENEVLSDHNAYMLFYSRKK